MPSVPGQKARLVGRVALDPLADAREQIVLIAFQHSSAVPLIDPRSQH